MKRKNADGLKPLRTVARAEKTYESAELAANVAKDVAPEKVPKQIQDILKKYTAWDLTVTPGWRSLWTDHVALKAVGDDLDNYGMNSAKASPAWTPTPKTN